jgi:hypothetical protein
LCRRRKRASEQNRDSKNKLEDRRGSHDVPSFGARPKVRSRQPTPAGFSPLRQVATFQISAFLALEAELVNDRSVFSAAIFMYARKPLKARDVSPSRL